MPINELIGKKVLIISPALNTPPEKKRMYMIGEIAEIDQPLVKFVNAKFTHLEGKVWGLTYQELASMDYMRTIGFSGVCWINIHAERIRIFPFDEES